MTFDTILMYFIFLYKNIIKSFRKLSSAYEPVNIPLRLPHTDCIAGRGEVLMGSSTTSLYEK